ncbi:MAG: PH domain-containing protein [Chitinophagaceae bacterium]|nr:PH domain-containing protein [Chitinophagaceae bacterium]
MMTSTETDWTKSQRQSPAALIIMLFKGLTEIFRFIWPLILLMIFRKKSSNVDTYEVIALVISIVSLARSGFEYFYFRFSIVNNELVIRRGFLTKKHITLPLEKIQAVHIEQTWLHKLLNVSRLSFDSAGSEKLEVKIDALDKQRSASLRKLILGTQRVGIEGQPEATVEEPLITLSGNDLMKLSLSANHLEAFLILVAFLYSSMESVGVSDKEYTGAIKWLNERVQSDPSKLMVLIGLFILLVSVALSVIKIILTYFEFTITRVGNGFRIASGLINKKEKFVPYKKIQFISWKANWVRQKIGVFLLQFHATGADHLQQKLQVKVPITRQEFITSLVMDYHPLLLVKEISPIRISRAFIFRKTLLLGVLPAFVLLPILYISLGLGSFLILALPILIMINSWVFQRRFRLWTGGDALQIKKGVFGTHELIVKWEKVQSVHIKQSLYQLGRGLASVQLYSAGGTIFIPYIPLMEARMIQNYSLYKIESALKPWA